MKRILQSVFSLGLVSALVVACGDDDASSAPPADISGNYSISVTDADNGCQLGNWVAGQSAQNIQFVVTQNGAALTGEVKGVAAIYFALAGIGPLQGSASGTHGNVTAVGTTSIKDGTCAFFYRVTADFTLTGNAINGTMTYSHSTNHDPSCGYHETCTSTQNVSGSRPPK